LSCWCRGSSISISSAKGLIDARVESLLTQGEIIAGAVAASASSTPTRSPSIPEKLLELQAGQSISPTNSNENLDFPINPERVAPVLRGLISPTRTRARIYDDDASLILDSRYLYTSARCCATTCPRPRPCPRA
jgi:two-component system sensor histidine kinase ChvG